MIKILINKLGRVCDAEIEEEESSSARLRAVTISPHTNCKD